jgi:hypothetical protein
MIMELVLKRIAKKDDYTIGPKIVEAKNKGEAVWIEIKFTFGVISLNFSSNCFLLSFFFFNFVSQKRREWKILSPSNGISFC